MGKYDALTKEELVRLMESRDRREATRFGLVWEASSEPEAGLNSDYVALDLVLINFSLLWWHRNLPHKPWAVSVLLPTGSPFFPDFVVGVRHRATPDHVLLADPKFGFANEREIPKTSARHPDYGRVFILHFENSRDWRVVLPSPDSGRPRLGEPFRFADLAGW